MSNCKVTNRTPTKSFERSECDNESENTTNCSEAGTEQDNANDTTGSNVNTKNFEESVNEDPNLVQKMDITKSSTNSEPGQVNLTVLSIPNATENVVNTKNVMDIDETTEKADAVNTDNALENDDWEQTRDRSKAVTDTDSTNEKEHDKNSPQLMESKTPTCDNQKKLRDALDGLLLLSSGKETMDEFAVSQDENDTIEFNQEIDMEDMMTALHIDSNNRKDDPNKDHTNKGSEQSTRSNKGRNRTSLSGSNTRPSPRSEPNVSVNTNNTSNSKSSQLNSAKGQIKIRSVTLKRYKEQTRNYYCSICNDNAPYKGLQALNIHHRESHDPVRCGVCNKWCSTPESL